MLYDNKAVHRDLEKGSQCKGWCGKWDYSIWCVCVRFFNFGGDSISKPGASGFRKLKRKMQTNLTHNPIPFQFPLSLLHCEVGTKCQLLQSDRWSHSDLACRVRQCSGKTAGTGYMKLSFQIELLILRGFKMASSNIRKENSDFLQILWTNKQNLFLFRLKEHKYNIFSLTWNHLHNW